ncbi:MAG: pitrilysin family protein [Candidatus Omnitrophica bacterium]|nr:pitrilysin family protein [Candidatus Omnitrophota bacterium]
MNKAISRIVVINLLLSFFFFSVPANAVQEDSVYTSENTQKRVLNNGMVVVLHETHKSPIVSIDILVKCGSASEARYAGSGISHLVEHLLFKSGNEKETNIASRKIKSFGGAINAFTTRDYTVFTVTVPRDYTSNVLSVLKKFIFFPSFDAIEINKEKEVILDEIRRGRDDPAIFISDLSWSSVFRDHPYKYPIIGHEDLFMRLAKEDVEYYFYHKYSPDNMVMVISGDIDKKSIFGEVEKIFSEVKRSFVAYEGSIAEPPQFERRDRIEYRSMALAHGVLSYRSASINDPSLYALDILATALGTGEGSILTEELRDNKKLVYAASCHNNTLRDSRLFYISFISEPDKTGTVTASILEILEGVKENGIKTEELEKAKKIATTEFLKSLETAEGRSLDLIFNEALTSNYLFSRAYMDKISAVTNDDIKAAARNYFDADKVNTLLLIPEKYVATGLPAADTRKQADSRNISNYVLPSGARIIICEDHSLPICTMSALFLGGVRFETKENNGISRLASALMLDGTTERKEEDIKKAIESIGGSVSNISGANSFGITMDLMGTDWKKGLEILSDVVMHATFDNAKIEKEKALTLAGIKERNDNIVQYGLLRFKRDFFGEHPYSMDPLGQAETIQSIKREDLLKFYQSFALPANMILAVTGDIDKNEVIAEIEKYFASFKKIDAKFPSVPSRKNLLKQEESTGSMDREQSIILIGFPAVKIVDNDKYAFEVIESIMSGSDGRLFNNVRSNLGISYSLGSLFIPGIEPGCYIFYAVTKSTNIKAAKDAIFKEIKMLKAEQVSEDELNAAKRHLIAANIINLEEGAALNLKMTLDELYGLGYENFKTYDSKINSITAGQIKRVANQYLNPDNCLIVTIYGTKEDNQ